MILGIIGGGQLGQMMTDSAHKMGLKVYVLDPNPKCPCSFNADKLIIKPYSEIDDLANMVDIITYEFENVDRHALKKHLNKVPQGIKALEITQNRNIEKENAQKLGLKTPRFKRVKNNLQEAILEIGFPSILKTACDGYDGHGQYVFNSREDLVLIDPSLEYILEEKILFDYEISVITARSTNGDLKFFPIPFNVHKHGILHLSIVDNRVPIEIMEKAKAYAKNFVVKNDFYGIIAIEFFVKGNELYFNEFAPRPHNSGHFTIEACQVSQFDASIKTILGQDIGNTSLIHNALMVNLLGQDMKGNIFNEESDKYIHLYHKDVAKVNRKMGHITYLNFTEDTFQFIDEHIKRD